MSNCHILAATDIAGGHLPHFMLGGYMLLLVWLTLAILAGDEAGLQELTFMARGFVESAKPLRAIFTLSGAILFLLLWLIAEP